MIKTVNLQKIFKTEEVETWGRDDTCLVCTADADGDKNHVFLVIHRNGIVGQLAIDLIFDIFCHCMFFLIVMIRLVAVLTATALKTKVHQVVGKKSVF